MDLIDEMSSSPICEGPSGPIDTPACEPTSFMSASLTAAILIKSKALAKKAANVDANGFHPCTCIPIADATNCCSAMNISKNLSGNCA